MKKVRLVTVTGSRTNTLWHMLNHYKHIVDEIYVVVYEWEGMSTLKEVGDILKNFPTAKIVRVESKEKFNWEYVTQLYNETKLMHPDDWWVVSDDDEFHIYSMPLPFMIEDCEENGWDIVRGGFLDRIGTFGSFPEIQPYKNIFEQFPLAGFFRYPLSGACPNKVCVMKGYVEVTSGQHYAKINGEVLWGTQSENKLIAPIDKYYTQVHHFKWDSTCVERIKAVADIRKDYAYSSEYLKMYQAIRRNNFEIDIANPEFNMEFIEQGEYSKWSELMQKIITI
jgi:hypothetical protein